MLLELADSQITYRLRYVMVAAPAPVIDLVALDPNNPRSVVYQLARIETHLAALPKRDDGRLTPPEQIAVALATRMRTADAAAIDEAALLEVEDGADEAVGRGRLDLFHDARALRSAVGGARMIYDVRQDDDLPLCFAGRLRAPRAAAHPDRPRAPARPCRRARHHAEADRAPRRPGFLRQPDHLDRVRPAARHADRAGRGAHRRRARGRDRRRGATPPWEEVRDGGLRLAPIRRRRRRRIICFRAARCRSIRRSATTWRLSFPPGRPVLDGATDLMRRIKAEFVYEVGATTVSTTPPMSFALRRGVCQDFAHIMISGMRVARPAGGLCQRLSADRAAARRSSGSKAPTPCMPGRWCGAGRRRLDRLRSDQRHPRRRRPVVLAIGRDYADVAPIDGVIFASGAQRLETSVHVVPVG